MIMFKLFRLCSNCDRLYEQSLANYMRYHGNGFEELSISSLVLEMKWDCLDCILKLAKEKEHEDAT